MVTSGQIELVEGRSNAPFTNIHDWVTLSDVDPLAKELYTIYRTHVNVKRGDDKVWATQISIAEMLGVGRVEKITKLNRILVGIKAIEIKRVGMPSHNEYVIHQAPPPGYAGPTTISEWYERKAEILASKRAVKAEKAERARQKRRSSPVTPGLGVQVTPESEVQVTPKPGAKQEELNNEERNKEEASASASPLARRRATKIHDPKVRDVTANTRSAINAAANELGDDAEVKTLVDYLWQHENASNAHGYIQHLIDLGGIDAKYETATEWADNLDEERTRLRGIFAGWRFPAKTADHLADTLRHALSIRCTLGDYDDRISGIDRSRHAALVVAADEMIADREAERAHERIERYREQVETEQSARAAA